MAMFDMLRRLGSALPQPAYNLYLCGLVTLVAVVLLVVEALLFPSRGLFVAVAIPTMVAALAAVHAISAAEPHVLDAVLGRVASSVGLGIGTDGRVGTLAVLLYCTGVIGAVAAYAWLALTESGLTRQDVVVQWGLMDKRQVVFAYLIGVAFVIFHRAMGVFFLDRRPIVRRVDGDAARHSWLWRLAGAVVIAVLAYCWIGASALHDVVAGDGAALPRFFEYHSHVHLGTLSQIRLGAIPYVEAQTQYGLGNLLLLYCLTDFISFSNHGFFAGVMLLDVICVIGFFVFVQQFLGLGWAITGLVGWAIWPSPAGVLDLAGWAILTRWLAIPVVALLLARLLLATGPGRYPWVGPLLAGAIWGAGAFMSQENLSGGLLVLLLSLGLYGPVCGRSLRSIASFGGLFIAGGAATFLLLVGMSVGLLNSLHVLRMAAGQSGQVMAGVSNSVWSDAVGLTLRYDIVHGWPYGSLVTHGDWRGVVASYGFALLLMLGIGLLAGFLGQSWASADAGKRRFVRRFAGVVVGACALHVFTLLRSDLSHLSGPSFLLPLFLLMLPVFAWRCIGPGLGRGLLLLVSVGLIAEALVVSRTEIGRRIAAVGTAWQDTSAALAIYRELRDTRAGASDPAGRYSTIARYQAPFRNHPLFEELQELAGLLRERLHGRPVELAFAKLDDLVTDPEFLYFFGDFRSVTGITSQKGSIWLRADEDDWIAHLLKAPAACVFFDTPSLDGRLFKAWNEAAKQGGNVVTEPIVGKRSYGVLSCRTAA